MILLIDCGSNKTKFIEEIVDNYCDVMSVPLLDVTIDHLQGKSGVILSGAPILFTEMDATPYLKRTEWIKTTELPILGICFGHQILSKELGGRVKKSNHREFGLATITKVSHSILTKNFFNKESKLKIYA